MSRQMSAGCSVIRKFVNIYIYIIYIFSYLIVLSLYKFDYLYINPNKGCLTCPFKN